jgi:hypothetical protein
MIGLCMIAEQFLTHLRHNCLSRSDQRGLTSNDRLGPAAPHGRAPDRYVAFSTWTIIKGAVAGHAGVDPFDVITSSRFAGKRT